MSTVALQSPPGVPTRSTEHVQTLERLFTRVGELSTLPHVATRIIQIADDDNTGTEDLLAAVESDPALAARVLRRVNSSYYALRNKVADLKSAISMLGFREMRNLALTAYVSRLFQDDGSRGLYSRSALWNHLVAVGTTARMIAKTCGNAMSEEAYLAGLLHDMGLILLDQHLHRAFCKVLDRVDESMATTDVEQDELTFDHAEVGAFVAEQWQLSEKIVATVRFHHQPQQADPQYRGLVGSVAVANYLCSRKGYSSLGVHNVVTPGDEVYAELGINQDQLAAIWSQLESSLQAADTMASI